MDKINQTEWAQRATVATNPVRERIDLVKNTIFKFIGSGAIATLLYWILPYQVIHFLRFSTINLQLNRENDA